MENLKVTWSGILVEYATETSQKVMHCIPLSSSIIKHGTVDLAEALKLKSHDKANPYFTGSESRDKSLLERLNAVGLMSSELSVEKSNGNSVLCSCPENRRLWQLEEELAESRANLASKHSQLVRRHNQLLTLTDRVNSIETSWREDLDWARVQITALEAARQAAETQLDQYMQTMGLRNKQSASSTQPEEDRDILKRLKTASRERHSFSGRNDVDDLIHQREQLLLIRSKVEEALGKPKSRNSRSESPTNGNERSSSADILTAGPVRLALATGGSPAENRGSKLRRAQSGSPSPVERKPQGKAQRDATQRKSWADSDGEADDQ